MKNWLITFFIFLFPFSIAPIIGSKYGAIHIPNEASAIEIIGTNLVTGYTIFQRDRVTPEELLIFDSTGVLYIKNSGPIPHYPPTFGSKICYSKPLNLYSDNPNDRKEVWQDSIGTSTAVDILSVCPNLSMPL